MKFDVDCPYGDQNLKCDVKYCASPYYRIGCCETCKVLANENLPQGRCEDEEKTSWCRNPSGHTCYKDHDLCCVGCAMIYDIAASGNSFNGRNSNLRSSIYVTNQFALTSRGSNLYLGWRHKLGFDYNMYFSCVLTSNKTTWANDYICNLKD